MAVTPFDAVLMSAPEPGPGALQPLVLLAREGDAEAFEGLMAATQVRVVSIAWRLLGSREMAREAAQEVYLRVFRSLRRFQPERDFHAWLYGITVNVCRDLGRQARRRARTFTSLEGAGQEPGSGGPDGPEGADSGLLLSERRAHVRAALETLAPGERAALVLRDLEGLTSEEAARSLGTTAGTVRAQVAAARRKVRLYCERVFGKAGAES